MKLVVQVPCLNEEDTLPLVLSSIPDSIPGIDEIVVVVIDDGSTDGTVAVARAYGVTEIVRHHRNQGLARSFTDGINHALAIGADIVVNTDGDNQYPQGRIGDLVQPILRGEADIVIADRQVGQIEHFSPAKKALQRFGSKVVNVAARTELPDAASGFRAYSRESLMRLNTVTRFSYCMETIIQAGNKNLAIASLPVLTNAKTRESRLFSSTRQHVFRSGAAIVRAYVMYRPYVIFGVMAALFGVLGLVPYVRYAALAATGDGGGHVQSLLVGAALVVMSSLCLMLGIVSDLIRTNRSLIETNLEHTKRARYDVLRVPHTAAIDTAPYETGGIRVKSLYIRAVRALAVPLRATGVLAVLRARAPHSRTATWLASLFAIHDVDGLRQLDVPWWTFDSADQVADWLRDRPEARVFEWGSGASTLWLAARAGTVHSVEHHAGWAGVLAPRLPANVDLRVVEAVASVTPAVRSAKPGHADLDFAAYVAAIDDVPGDFDVVVIDGRAREACLVRAVERLAPGGLIVFDNVDRQRYVDAIEAVGDRLTLTMTRGLTPALPYPTRTALLRSTEPAEAP